MSPKMPDERLKVDVFEIPGEPHKTVAELIRTQGSATFICVRPLQANGRAMGRPPDMLPERWEHCIATLATRGWLQAPVLTMELTTPQPTPLAATVTNRETTEYCEVLGEFQVTGESGDVLVQRIRIHSLQREELRLKYSGTNPAPPWVKPGEFLKVAVGMPAHGWIEDASF